MRKLLYTPTAPAGELRDRCVKFPRSSEEGIMLKNWRDYWIIKRSGLFDPIYYLMNNPDVRRADIDPLMHFVKYGWKENRNPSNEFSISFYSKNINGLGTNNINPLIHYIKYGKKNEDIYTPLNWSILVNQRLSAVLFVSGCPGDSQRYRCIHQAEELSFCGYTCSLAEYGTFDLMHAIDQYRCFILHRVPYGPDIEAFISLAKASGKVILFDTDDFIFDSGSYNDIAALDLLTGDEKMLYVQGLERYRKTLLECNGVTVTTEQLKLEVMRLNKLVQILPNVVSLEMVQLAEKAFAENPKRDNTYIVVAYLSGTYTHNRDFLEAADAILWALENYPQLRFEVVGYLDLDERFDRYKERISFIPLQPWQKLPEILREIDINLAPLEKNNRFTESKSCIKYLEAGLLKVPTIASSRKDFARVIDNGNNGFLVDSPEEWKKALEKLVESKSLREKIGQMAYENVKTQFTTVAHSKEMEQKLRNLIISTGYQRRAKTLTINWILRAPIASTGGGYRTIFRLANYLGIRGHQVRLYVEAIAHLAGLSDGEIIQFCETNFGPLSADIYIGHENILPADATIATNWPTAYTVFNHKSSIYKFYFVQDYEPEFYDILDPLYEAAEKTYYLPLQFITIGDYLSDRLINLNGRNAETIPFGIDSKTFHVTQRPEKRFGNTKVLFFARPGLKRRGYHLGLQALELAKKMNPDLKVYFFGTQTSELGEVPFEFVNLGVLSPTQVAAEMNDCHILLSLSLSNISWVPFEGMACGAAVIEADVPSVRRMVNENAIRLANPNPEAIAESINQLSNDSNYRINIANNGIEYMKSHKWENTCQHFEKILIDRCIL